LFKEALQISNASSLSLVSSHSFNFFILGKNFIKLNSFLGAIHFLLTHACSPPLLSMPLRLVVTAFRDTPIPSTNVLLDDLARLLLPSPTPMRLVAVVIPDIACCRQADTLLPASDSTEGGQQGRRKRDRLELRQIKDLKPVGVLIEAAETAVQEGPQALLIV
jgi:hypothetical protein